MARARRRNRRRHQPDVPATPPPPAPSILSSKHQQTLAAIFADPIRANIAWNDVVALLLALGARVNKKGGSMHGFTLNGARAVLHKPHPANELVKAAVRQVRRFLTTAGVSP